MAKPWQVFVCCRTSMNWRAQTLETFVQNPRLKQWQRQMPKMVDSFIRMVEIWNSTLKLSYFQYRHHIKEIAVRSWRSIHGARVITETELNSIQDGLLLAVDDDDWFAPEIVRSIHSYPRNDLYIWDSAAWWPGRYAERHVLRRKEICFTNNFAFSIRVLKLRRLNMREHTAFTQLFRSWVPCHIKQPLSMTHKSMASFSVLRRMQSGQQLKRMFKQLIYPQIYPAWATPYVEAVRELNQRLF